MKKSFLKEVRSKAPGRLAKEEYFDWLEKSLDDAIFEAREFELDDIDDSLFSAKELSTSKEFKEGIDCASRILFQRRIQLRKDRIVL